MSLNILDNIHKIEALDSYLMRASIDSLAEQIEEIIGLNYDFKLPKIYKKVNQIAIFGMGGSALSGHLLRNLYAEKMNVPMIISNDYDVPNYVNDQTLVICSSYSGNTEEVISVFKQAQKKKAKIVVLTKGGSLKKLAEKNKIPFLQISDQNNPCGSPRMGLGYSIFGLFLILNAIDQVKLSDINFSKILNVIDQSHRLFSLENNTDDNDMKKVALAQHEKSVWFIGAEYLSGSAHIAANQMNENAKKFAGYYLLPELNHHLLEGLSFPQKNSENIIFIFLESKKYSAKILKRISITKKILTKKNISYTSINLCSNSKIEQVFESLVASSYLSFYAAILNGVDPTPIPEVEYFKKEMNK